jgi:hypothetical protein
MSSPETLTPMATARRATGGTPYSPVYRAEPAFPQKPLWTHHRSSLLISLCRSSHSVRMWTPSANAGGKQRPEMHVTTRRH